MEKPNTRRDLRESGRIILAHGEATGHLHEVLPVNAAVGMPAAEFFEDPSNGKRMLMVMEACSLVHTGHHESITLDPNVMEQVRQGDVCLKPVNKGLWEVIRQTEQLPEGLRQVAD